MKNVASIVGLAIAVLVTDYLVTKIDGTPSLDRYPLKKKNNKNSEE